MVQIIWNYDPLLLFSDEQRIGVEGLENISVQGGRIHQLTPCPHGVTRRSLYVSLLCRCTVPGRKRKNDRAMWKHVLPTSTSFVWLSPELANLFCSDALQIDDTRAYGNSHVAHLGLGFDFSAHFVIQGLFYLGETRSAEHLAMCTCMTPERLCLGCGLRADEDLCPLPPQDRSGLFKAATRLLQLVLSEVPLPDETDEEKIVKQTLMTLVHNKDGHFLATLSSLLLSLLEGKRGLLQPQWQG